MSPLSSSVRTNAVQMLKGRTRIKLYSKSATINYNVYKKLFHILCYNTSFSRLANFIFRLWDWLWNKI